MPNEETRQIRWTGREFVLVTDDSQIIEPEAGDMIYVANSKPGYSLALAKRDLRAGTWCMPGTWRMIE